MSPRNRELYLLVGEVNMKIERCQKELNIVPYKNGNRLSETLIEFYPLATALQLDADEPMDP